MAPDGTPPNQDDLLAAFHEVANQYNEPAVPPSLSRAGSRRGTRPWVFLLLLVASGILGYVWLGRPTWLYPPDPSLSQSPAQREASLRFGIYLQSERVRAFRRDHGRLPHDLEETGEVEEGVAYRQTGDSTFLITGTDDSLTFTLSSEESPAKFLEPVGIKVSPIGQ
jgi:hypothetical protein